MEKTHNTHFSMHRTNSIITLLSRADYLTIFFTGGGFSSLFTETVMFCLLFSESSILGSDAGSDLGLVPSSSLWSISTTPGFSFCKTGSMSAS